MRNHLPLIAAMALAGADAFAVYEKDVTAGESRRERLRRMEREKAAYEAAKAPTEQEIVKQASIRADRMLRKAIAHRRRYHLDPLTEDEQKQIVEEAINHVLKQRGLNWTAERAEEPEA